MRIPQEPLTTAETTQLQQLLAESGARPLAYARGVFSSTATSPVLRVPTDWLPLVLGGQFPDKQALDQAFALLMREYNSVCDCLALGVPVVPASTDAAAVREFCQGYVRVVQKDELWKRNQEAFALLMPIAVLSEYVNAETLDHLAPDFARSPEEWTAEQRDSLSETVMTSYRFWEGARAEAADSAAAEGDDAGPPAKIGRNDLCPCRSGKKYKKCCGAPS